MSNNVATGSVDPELLSLRLGSLDNADDREQATAIVNATYACLSRINAIDFGWLERDKTSGPARALWTSAEGGIATIWAAIEELRATSQPLVEAHQERFGGDDAGGDSDEDPFGGGLFEDDAGAGAPKKPAPTTPIQRIGETVWATSFVLSSEVDGFRKRLPALINVPDAWELLANLQDHAAHIRAALQAILTGVFASLYPGSGLSATAVATPDEQNIELLSSRELRQRIFALRDEVVGIETAMLEKPAGEWQPLLRKIVDALGGFMFGPGFAWMRAGDKRTFITQQRALRDILEMWSPLRATPAKRAVQNLARYLEALEVINQRECLVVHDRAALNSVVASLTKAKNTPGPESRPYIGAALAALAEAQGRDRVLDAMLEQTMAPGSVVPTLLILERAQELLARL